MPSFSSLLFTALAATTFVSAHGNVQVVTGDAGGNGTALGIQGGIVPLTGRNKITEVDTTVFKKTDIATDGLGKTTGGGKNKPEDLAAAMQLSGTTLPQVRATNGSISGTFHVVTTDGAGPIFAVIDPTATGAFASGIQASILTDVPGNNGNIKPNGMVPRSLHTLSKRAANVNRDFPFQIAVPAGTACNGTVAGQQKVCFMKIANENDAGPFGGVVAFQITDEVAPVDACGAKAAVVPRRFSA